MTKRPRKHGAARSVSVLACIAAASYVVVACSGDDGAQGPPGSPGGSGTGGTPTDLARSEDPPGIDFEVTGLTGGTGPAGNFAPGNIITVNFTAKKDDGTNWDLSELSSGTILVSGPTFNYNPVIDRQGDFLSGSVQQPDGSYRYTFSVPIPSVYQAPANDTTSFGLDDGELQGEALLDGTYTVGFYAGWNYTVEGESFRDSGDTTYDFLLGSTATTIESRDVVGQQNCNSCHSDLQFHGGLRRATTLCLLCHTAGSEDKNVASAAGGTPGETVEFSIMIHRIHNGAHLPSVLGVTTDTLGERDYSATPEPYQLVGFGNNVHDYSEITFPVWPNIDSPMPRDSGYSALTNGEQSLEDQMRRGVTNCVVCHGDPDGSGPATAPEDGDLAYTQLQRKTCGSCHDDWVYDQPYTANMQTMPAQSGNATCTLCHAESGDGLAVRDAHMHPLEDSSFATGLNLAISDVSEGGTNDGDDTLDPGEKAIVTFTLQDDTGADVAASTLDALDVGFSGPNENMTNLLFTSFPTAMLSGPQPYVSPLPMQRYYEYIGTATAGVDAFATNFSPHWNVAGAETEVYERIGTAGGASTLTAATGRGQNYFDVTDATGFDRDDFIVVDDGSVTREYLQIQFVEGDRLWFSSPATSAYPPGPQQTHAAGATVLEVTVALLTEGVEYSLDAATGTVTETGGFATSSDVIVSYTTDFVVPSTYGVTFNQGDDLGSESGLWAGLPLESGTYSLTLWGSVARTLMEFGESNSYREVSPGFLHDVLVGDATTVEPYSKISSPGNCYTCHVDLAFHGGRRRGYETCVICHGVAGAGDRPQYVAANAPETAGVSIAFRDMLHKIHHGSQLANAETYEVIGFGTGYPNNFSSHAYGEVTFPSFPAGTMDCAICHGEGNDVWIEPAERMHSAGQPAPTQAWSVACGSCHDASAQLAHMAAQTAPDGAESCAVCHSPGKFAEVEVVHTPR